MKWFQLLVFGTIGLVAVLFGIIWGLDFCTVFRNNVSTRGVVVGQSAEMSRKPGVFRFFPVVEFSAGGTAVRFRDAAGSEGTPEPLTGSAVNVLYDPREPSRARIGTFRQLWLAPALMCGSGLVLLSLSCFLFIRLRRFEKALGAVGRGRS